jgi:hypothetical protein
MLSLRIPAAAVLVPVFVLSAVAAGEVSGEFTAGKRKPIRPKFAAAYDDRDQRNARMHVVGLVLSEAPVDIAAAVASLDPHTHLINQDALRDRNYVLLWVKADGEVSMNATYAENMTQFADATTESLKAELTANTADKVAGRLYTPKPVKTMSGETYSVNLTLSAAVTRLPAGAKLAAGGGEPGKAFDALMAGVSKKSWDGIVRNLSEDNIKNFSDHDKTAKERLDDAVERLGFWLQKSPATVTGGEVRGDSSVLEVEGEIFKGRKMLFLINMIKSGNRWVFDSAAKRGFVD